VSAVHPGLVKTNLADAAVIPGPFQLFLSLFGPLVYADTDTGSWTSVFCAAGDEMTVEQSGTYFQRIAKAGWQNCNAKDLDLAKKLEDYTIEEMGKGGWAARAAIPC
jgi:retinol dehydrogenase-12